MASSGITARLIELTFAHVCTTSDLALMLLLVFYGNPPAQDQPSLTIKFSWICNNLIKDLVKTLMFENGIDVDGIRVG